MNLTTRVGLLAGASALTLTSVSFADGSSEAQDLQARIAELESRVAQLQGGDEWLTEQRAEEIRGLVHDVLADADTRASLLQSGMSSGYNGGFVISSSDGNFSLKMNGNIQTRVIYNNADQGLGATDESLFGFESTRTQLMFSGNVGSPAWTYMVSGDFGRGTDGGDFDGEFDLDDAWIGYDMGDGWSVMMGQMKVPLNREYLVHSSNQLAVERSMSSYLYSGLRTQGLAVDYAGDDFHFTAALTDGAGTANTTAVPNGGDSEYSITARGEFLLSGNWDQFKDFTSKQGNEQGMMVGAGVHVQKAEFGTGAPNETEVLILTGDFSAEWDGANLFASVTYSNYDDDATVDSDQLAIVVQGGYYLNEDTEIFARYEWADFDDATPGSGATAVADLEDLNSITVGVNKYYTANVKSTLDLVFGIDEYDGAAGAWVPGITGSRNDAANQDGQFVLRGQLQLTF